MHGGLLYIRYRPEKMAKGHRRVVYVLELGYIRYLPIDGERKPRTLHISPRTHPAHNTTRPHSGRHKVAPWFRRPGLDGDASGQIDELLCRFSGGNAV